MRRVPTAAWLLCAVFLSGSAQAAPLIISTSGVWGASAPSSTWTAPGKTWAFSFVVDDHPILYEAWDSGFRPFYSSFLYGLDGVDVATDPWAIAFNTYATLTVRFPGAGFELFGPQAFSGPASAPTIEVGSYLLRAQPFTVVPYFELESGFGQDLTGTVVEIAPSPAAVPEPTTLLLFGTGLVGLRAWRRRR